MGKDSSHYSVREVQHLHDVVLTVLLSHSVVILCTFLIDKIVKETNGSLFRFFSLSAVHNMERNITAKEVENNSLSLEQLHKYGS